MTAPEITDEQRHDALIRANKIRTYRAEKKKDVKAGREPFDFLLVRGPHDERLRTMKVREALLSMPGIGKERVDRMLQRAMVSPSKTLAGMSPQQWERLYRVLEDYPALRKRLSATEPKV